MYRGRVRGCSNLSSTVTLTNELVYGVVQRRQYPEQTKLTDDFFPQDWWILDGINIFLYTSVRDKSEEKKCKFKNKI